MKDRIKDIFNEDEWRVLNAKEEELSKKVENLPMHVVIVQDRMGKGNE